jgi:lipid-A-disaccharide synthase-like uncharacterized protein
LGGILPPAFDCLNLYGESSIYRIYFCTESDYVNIIGYNIKFLTFEIYINVNLYNFFIQTL